MKDKTKKKIASIIISALIVLIILSLLIVYRDNLITFWNNLKISFTRTLIEENRYELYLKGLKLTLILSSFSIIFGTILGVLVCFLNKSKIKILSKLAKIFVSMIQGTPIPVLLLIFYYAIFGNIDIDPMIVGIITFSIYFSAYVSEILRASIESINKSQLLAAYSLGFTKIQTIKYIFLPQALSYILPTYRNEVVSLIKLTSIGGYISIFELTKASDVIRNRTYEAFFPLIFTAFIYFLICKSVGYILDYINKKIDPRLSKRKLVK